MQWNVRTNFMCHFQPAHVNLLSILLNTFLPYFQLAIAKMDLILKDDDSHALKIAKPQLTCVLERLHGGGRF